MAEPVAIDIVSDVMCPWCFIGKRNLEAAIAALDGISVSLHWRPYQLDPTLPKEGKDRKTYLADKFGGIERADELHENIVKAGTAAGIAFDFNAIRVSPNTLDAHRLIHWAGGEGQEVQNRIVERLFSMYFSEGRNIGSADTLVEAAGDAGMDREIVSGLLAGDADRETVRTSIAQAQSMGVRGVPFFILDNRYAISGAQPPQAMAEAIRTVAGHKAAAAGKGETGK
jgi:predicted DsbA family dithiol-disulfide isomerase